MRELNFRPGDKIKVHYKIIEGGKVRVQPFDGVVLAVKGQDLVSRSFTVRKIGAGGVGVERIFPLQSPNIEKIEVMEKGRVRRAKLYYLRGRIGKAALKVKLARVEKDVKKVAKPQPVTRAKGRKPGGGMAQKPKKVANPGA